MLTIKDLHAGYGESQILHGVSLEVAPGELVVLIGPNGAGKSTVLRSVFGLVDVTSGSMRFEGREITKLPTSEHLARGIGYVSQGRPIFATMTVKENLDIAGDVLRLDRKEREKRITKMFKKFPMLKTHAQSLAGNLSGGQQQTLAIARSLILQPKLLLMDEPSLGLAPKTMMEVFEMIQQIVRDGVAVLLVEQNAKHAVTIADRTIVLENGKVALEGGKEILRHEMIKRIYLGGG